MILSIPLLAQLEVKEGSFKDVPGFINANPDENYQTDDNNLPFAVIKVRTENINDKQRRQLKFGGNGGTFIMLEYKDGEVWVYLTAKYADYLKISHPDFSSIEFTLPYDLKPKCGYEMTLVNKSPNIDKNNYLIIKADQQNAEIYIDDELMGTGYASKVVSIGEEHRYKVSCDDYFPKEGLVYFDEREDKEISVDLEPNFGYITIKSEPSGAEIYIDDQIVGTTPYLSEQIQLGRRRIELKKMGYEPFAKVVTIKSDEDENKLLENVKLTAIRIPMGSLDLSSNPVGAVITINGRQYGQTPKTLTDFEVGTYKVYFSKEGYQNLSQTVEVKDGKKETLSVTMTKMSAPHEPYHDYVDLGLPSGVLWATCNVGATTPEGYGCYFAWGESKPKDTYSWGTYLYCNGSDKTLTKYGYYAYCGNNGYTDNLITLQPEDDAATVNWGNNWRMPTQAEWEELYQYTTRNWSNYNGVGGMLFTASNGNSLFLPAAGWYDSSYHNYLNRDVYYWSSSLNVNDNRPDVAWSIGYYTTNTDISTNYRYRGFAVRPVRNDD